MIDDKLSVVDRVKDLRRIRGVRVNNTLGFKHLEIYREALRNYTQFGIVEPSGSTLIYFQQHPQTDVVLALEKFEEPYGHGLSRLCEIRYGFFNRAGIPLPEPECFGKIRGKDNTLERCLSLLCDGFVPLEITVSLG